MPHHYLFGPASAAFAEQYLSRARQAGDCLTFGYAEGVDLVLTPAVTSWAELASRLPAGWQPELVILDLASTILPMGLWSAPVPLVGLARDWNLLWHLYRRLLPRCDLVLSDAAGVEALTREGISPALAVNLIEVERNILEMPPLEEGSRDIDVLFIGNLHPAVARERLSWLGRLAQRGERWKITIGMEGSNDDYRALLRRARVVFNRSTRGESNGRIFEAAAVGTLLFQEAGNRELAPYFRDGRECVVYTDDNLEALLDHYLTHEEERRTLAEAARRRLQSFGFGDPWEDLVQQVEQHLIGSPGLSHRRSPPTPVEDLLGRTWQFLDPAAANAGPALQADLEAALAAHPDSAPLNNALGLVLARDLGREGSLAAEQAERALVVLRRAAEANPFHPLAGLNLAEILMSLGRDQAAVEEARRALALLERAEDIPRPAWDDPHFPPRFDHFRVEWERAAWAQAGSPAAEARAKRDLVRWRLHTLLAGLTDDLDHYYEAALARPDLPPTQAALGCALGRRGRGPDGIPHLRQAVQGNPFDLDAARALFQALGEARDEGGQARLSR